MRGERLPIATARASFHHCGFGGLGQPAVDENLCAVLKPQFRRKRRISFQVLCCIFTTIAKFQQNCVMKIGSAINLQCCEIIA